MDSTPVDRVVLGIDEFQRLVTSNALESPGEQLHSSEGELLFSEGTAAAGLEKFIETYLTKQAMILILRGDVNGSQGKGIMWLSPEGILRGGDEPGDTVVELRHESGGDRFRALIDMLGLGPRPAPPRGFDPVEISRKVFENLTDDESSSASRQSAADEIADLMRSLTPQVADCLAAGRWQVLITGANWNSPYGDQVTYHMCIDTPAGYLFYTAERNFLKKRHYLEPAPAWFIFSTVISRLPPKEDVAWWFELE